jgi:hypothetical protein
MISRSRCSSYRGDFIQNFIQWAIEIDRHDQTELLKEQIVCFVFAMTNDQSPAKEHELLEKPQLFGRQVRHLSLCLEPAAPSENSQFITRYHERRSQGAFLIGLV